MNLINIKDVNTPELFIYKQLRDNAFQEDNSFIADSPKVVNQLLKQKLQIKSLLATQEYYDEFQNLIKKNHIEKLYVASKKIMENIVGHKIHHNVMMHGIRPQQVALNELDKQIIMLENITSTENVGSIARSAAALGVNSYLLPTQGPHPFGRRALRVSMGHMAKLKTHRYEDIKETIKELKKEGYIVIAAEITKESIPLSQIEVPEKWVLLMGHEGHGISKEILALCSKVVHIEMEKHTKSFNVAVAASIIMYQLSKNKLNIKN